MNRKISKARINAAVASGACEQAVRWLRRRPRTYMQLFCLHFDWFRWAFNNDILPDSIVSAYYSM